MSIISSKIKPDSVVYTDSWRSYNTLDVSRFHHEHINHSTDFAKGKNHINGIENFWNQAKRVLRKCNRIHLNTPDLNPPVLRRVQCPMPADVYRENPLPMLDIGAALTKAKIGGTD